MNGIEMIARERARHPELGWTAQHDAQWMKGEIANAAMAYLFATADDAEAVKNRWIAHTRATAYWPWDKRFWKPKTRVENLVRAGALLSAEIDRLLALEERK